MVFVCLVPSNYPALVGPPTCIPLLAYNNHIACDHGRECAVQQQCWSRRPNNKRRSAFKKCNTVEQASCMQCICMMMETLSADSTGVSHMLYCALRSKITQHVNGGILTCCNHDFGKAAGQARQHKSQGIPIIHSLSKAAHSLQGGC